MWQFEGARICWSLAEPSGIAAYVACFLLLCQGSKWLNGKCIWLVFRRSWFESQLDPRFVFFSLSQEQTKTSFFQSELTWWNITEPLQLANPTSLSRETILKDVIWPLASRDWRTVKRLFLINISRQDCSKVDCMPHSQAEAFSLFLSTKRFENGRREDLRTELSLNECQQWMRVHQTFTHLWRALRIGSLMKPEWT